MKIFAFGFVAFVLGAISTVGTLIVINATPATTSTAHSYESPPPNIAQPSSSVWEGPFQRDLGIRSDVYGSDWQGRELQAMVNLKRNAQVYRLNAQTSQGEHVEITADLRDTGSIYRKHWDSIGGGPARAESWTGNVLTRIDNAASGKGFGGDVAVRTV